METPKRLVTQFMAWATGRLCPCANAGLSAGPGGIAFCQNLALDGAIDSIEIFGGYAARDHGHQPVGRAA